MTISIPNQPKVLFKGIQSFPKIISALQPKRLLHKSGLGYLAYIIGDQKNGLKIGDISIVKDFSDVFLEDFLGLSPNKEIEL